MLKPQKKMTKKELKEDKFVEAAMSARAYIEDNYKQVSIITAVVFGLFVLIMGYNYVHTQTVAESSTLLGKAQVEYQNMNYTKAQRMLDRLSTEYAGTDAADQGLFLLGNLYYQQDKIELAEDAYRGFIDSYGGSSILLASGYAGYAACQEKKEDYAQAAEYYLKARKEAPEFVEASNYLYLAALNFIALNDFESARKNLEMIVEKYQDSTRETDAKAKLILISKK